MKQNILSYLQARTHCVQGYLIPRNITLLARIFGISKYMTRKYLQELLKEWLIEHKRTPYIYISWMSVTIRDQKWYTAAIWM